ncbi:surface-adhesin E family protein [Scytonema sp. NUACC26]|uniref:surface-adhesin E family protein n=1 Tax=Scytonema sp. NUACC26 TaxID=3140176 RepID=UPI0034DCC35D
MKSFFYKGILAIATTITLNSPFLAQANEDKLWIPINNRIDGSTYLDANSITHKGNTKTFWLYVTVNKPNPQGWSKILAQGVANCSTKYTIYRQAKVYDSQDKLVKSVPLGAIKQLKIEAITTPDASPRDVADLVCSLN